MLFIRVYEFFSIFLMKIFGEISDSHGGEYENVCFLVGCFLLSQDAVYSNSTSETSVNFYNSAQHNIQEVSLPQKFWCSDDL